MKRVALLIFPFFISAALVESMPLQPTHCKNYSYGAVMNAAISSPEFIRESPLASTKGEFSQCLETISINMMATIDELVPGPSESWSSRMMINIKGIFPVTSGSSRLEIPPANVTAVRQQADGTQHVVKFSGPVVMVFADQNANLSFFNWYDNPYFPEQTTLVRHSFVSAVRRRDNN